MRVFGLVVPEIGCKDTTCVFGLVVLGWIVRTLQKTDWPCDSVTCIIVV